MYKTQAEFEAQYSRANVRHKIMQDIEYDHVIFIKAVSLIDKYRSGSYYHSKTLRIASLVMSSTDIATELFIAVLPIKEISPIQAVATLLGSRLTGITGLLDQVKTAAELLAVCELSSAYTIYHSEDYQNNTGTMGIRAEYSLDADTQDFINQTKYLPPMIHEPIPWSSNLNGGYLQGSKSLILGHLNHHGESQALAAINILQSIAWSINNMVEYVEPPSKDLDTPQQIQQFDIMKDQSTVVYNELRTHGNKFYFVWKYDKRGRMYSQGYHCNLQGTEYKKAILNFAKKELIQ